MGNALATTIVTIAVFIVCNASGAMRPAPNEALKARLAEGVDLIGIVHWGLNTYTDREWGYGDEDPAMLNPMKFDADQIVGACRDGGLRGLVIVAKHHDGFCLWPTKTTKHNITKSPFWNGGLGVSVGRNYVKEMEQACRRAGLKFGVYVSPWDRSSAYYGTEKYVEIYHEQIRELVSGDYGEIFEIWFDGANGGDGWYGGANERRKISAGYYRFDKLFRFVRSMQPTTTVFAGEYDDSDFRWPGNERGILVPGSRATICATGGFADGVFGNSGYAVQKNTGSVTGEFFRVCEADFPLRKGWFYHESDRGTTKRAAYLAQRYVATVGNGGTMNIGIAPNKDGVLDAEDVRELKGFEKIRTALFAQEVTDAGKPFNVVELREDLANGEQVDGWRILADGREILSGTAIGNRRIRLLAEPISPVACQLEITADGGSLRSVALRRYNADPQLVKSVIDAVGDGGETDTVKMLKSERKELHVPACRNAGRMPAQCDVLVVGGGVAGVAAAAQSARAGARTVLVEQGFQVGGTMTSGGVNFPGLFHAWGRQVIDGVAYEIVTNCVALDGGRLPDFSKPTGKAHWNHQIRINIPLYVALAESTLVEAGVVVCYHTAPMSILPSERGWRLELSGMGRVCVLHAKQVVDCTGNASVASLAGFERMSAEERQPGSFVYTLDPGCDVDDLDGHLLEKEYRKALKDGRLEPNDTRWGIMAFLRAKGGTANYVVGADNSSAELRTETNMRGRAAMLRMFRFVRSQKGLENAKIVGMSAEVGVRETYRIKGEYVISGDDYVSGRVHLDSLCYAFYPVDMHRKEDGVHPRHLVDPVVPTVPLRALVPRGSRNFMVAGRAVSSDRVANSGLRVEAACMAMGQVAGEAAAFAAKTGVSPLELPLSELKKRLEMSGAIVPSL